MTTTIVVSPEAFEAGWSSIEGEDYRHLFRAKRLPRGARVRVVDGGGRARWGTVESVDRREGIVRLGDPAPTNEPLVALTVAAACPKPDRASWLVEKTTELGVSRLVFLTCRRSSRSFGEGRLGRLRRVAEAAVAQSHRALVPGIESGDLASVLAEDLPGAWLDPGGEGSPSRLGESGAEVVVIGPEGGWSEEERDLLGGSRLYRVGLGDRVLRIETAAAAAVTLALVR